MRGGVDLFVNGTPVHVDGDGTKLYENTKVLEIGDRMLRCDRGTVRADIVVRATEGFTARLPRHRRAACPPARG